MPIYEYECPKCGKKFELIRMDKECNCPKCGQKCEPKPSRYSFQCPLN